MNDIRNLVADMLDRIVLYACDAPADPTSDDKVLIARANAMLQSLPADGELIPKPSHSPAVVVVDVAPCLLLPCPFCGSNGEIDAPSEDRMNTPGAYYEWMVKCSGNWCDANVTDHRSEADAVKLWNARAYSQPAAQVPDSVIAILSNFVADDPRHGMAPEVRDYLKSLQGAGHGQGPTNRVDE